MIKAKVRRVFMTTAVGRAAWAWLCAVWVWFLAIRGRLCAQVWRVETAGLWRTRRSTLYTALPPLVIGGTGGSGTRVIARLTEQLGVFMGVYLSVVYDATTLDYYLNAWRAEIPRVWTDVSNVPWRMDRDLECALLKQRQGIPRPESVWGFKNPRVMFYLPHLHRLFPNLKFIHLVRDGRDMAFSSNHYQLDRLGNVYSHTLRTRLADAPLPVRAVTLWSESNCAIARWGEVVLGSRYLRIRFEDLCVTPATVVRQVSDFLEAAPPSAKPLAMVKPPTSIGRWRAQDPALVDRVRVEGEAGLRAFGYLDT